MKEKSANKALCLNNLVFHIENSQGSTLQTNKQC